MGSFSKWASQYADWGPVVVRVVLGLILVMHGWQKITNLPGTVNAFSTAMGQPGWLAYVATVIEFFGGILILIGLFTRYAALLAALEMAYIIIFLFWSKGLAGFQLEFALFGMAVALTLRGPSRWSLEKEIFKKEW